MSEDKLLIALIAAGSALTGSLIPQVFAFFNSRSQNEFEKEKSRKNIQADIYEKLLINLQLTMNKGNEAFSDLQKSVIQISLYGDEITARVVEIYYSELVHRGYELKKEEHALHQKNILNAMRSQIDLEPLESFELIRFDPVQKPNNENS